MKVRLRLSREAVRYKKLYAIAILSSLCLTGVNLAAPKVLAGMTGIVEKVVDPQGMKTILLLTFILVLLYLLRILLRFLSNFMAHKAAWYLVGDLRTKTYDKLERLHLGYFHDKQTGDLMSRVVNDTRDFELLYAHIIPDMMTINPKLALITGIPLPLILASGFVFVKKVRPYFRINQKKMGELNAKLQDNLSGVHEIQSMAGAERVLAILDAPFEIADREGAEDIGCVAGSITFEHVDFAYQAESPVLKDVSFHCQAGKMLALVGPTGVGKTTLTQLISRFYERTAGRILIDGRDIAGVTLESLRRNISPVLQNTFLFNGTIAENIGYAKPDASMEEIRQAAMAANIHEDIAAMPDGYETQVGERGLHLSGGQKQRVAIARAILRQSPIIILDEATASVDVETEQQIQKAIAGIAGSRIIVAIAHRGSTIRNADMILVLEEGRVTEMGTHAELVALGGAYARMDAIQSAAAVQAGIA